MGNLFGNCFKADDEGKRKKKSKSREKEDEVINNSKKDRVTDNDRAILDVKGRLKQIKIYKDKIEI